MCRMNCILAAVVMELGSKWHRHSYVESNRKSAQRILRRGSAAEKQMGLSHHVTSHRVDSDVFSGNASIWMRSKPGGRVGTDGILMAGGCHSRVQFTGKGLLRASPHAVPGALGGGIGGAVLGTTCSLTVPTTSSILRLKC